MPSVVAWLDHSAEQQQRVREKLALVANKDTVENLGIGTVRNAFSHAKFVITDHAVILLTSANLSFSAENRNIEFGLLVRDAALVEATMTRKHGSLYTVVGA